MSKLFKVTMHTEYAGAGKVVALQVFGGAGRCIPMIRGKGRDGKPLDARHWPNVTLRGFTVYVRTAQSSARTTWGEAFRRIAITSDANRFNLFKAVSS